MFSPFFYIPAFRWCYVCVVSLLALDLFSCEATVIGSEAVVMSCPRVVDVFLGPKAFLEVRLLLFSNSISLSPIYCLIGAMSRESNSTDILLDWPDDSKNFPTIGSSSLSKIVVQGCEVSYAMWIVQTSRLRDVLLKRRPALQIYFTCSSIFRRGSIKKSLCMLLVLNSGCSSKMYTVLSIPTEKCL